MFKGIITNVGSIFNIVKDCISIKTQGLLSINNGDSIACGGVCLTATNVIDDIFKIQVSQATLKVTNINTWKIDSKVNIEQALKLNDRIDGHLLQGHIDGVVLISAIKKNINSYEIEFLCPKELIKFIAKKGSVALDGVSFTVNSVTEETFTINVIPYTWENTTFQYRKVNDLINLEVDLIARYLEQLIKKYDYSDKLK
ncbi:riboflavin synthase [Wolbachia endosymbiont of Pentidionis agamae]|uniref:riboflavin synthase n=1 Tax=Wolbachia endosymbiont of Pentidionis agamae TaxID=3110435 RepID=UPI002FD6C3A9